MSTHLGQNQYGKAETRVVRVTREGATHRVRDLSVSVALSGDMDDVHYSGSNTNVLPTDTTKNTVFALAKEHGIESPEDFGIHLARHFVTSRPAIRRARIRIEEYGWERIATAAGAGSGHSFTRNGRETRTAEVGYDGEHWQVVPGLKDLVVMNTTDSEFWGYDKDRYTTLKEAYDRVLATEVTARWRLRWTGDEQRVPAWESSYDQVRGHLLRAFAETYSLSLQQTLYAMGSRVIDGSDGAGGTGGTGGTGAIDEIRLSLPNKHHFLVDLEPFGLTNDNEVYFAADRPYGLIEGTVLRDGAEAAILVPD